jgi:predicted membrane protein
MGPYYRATTQSTGAFFDIFYEHPLLMLAFVLGVIGVGAFMWQKNKASK